MATSLGDDPMISTGDAAELLGVSRQHVVDLCDRELLDSVRVGRHRRIRRSAVLEMLPAPARRDVERLLWLHGAVAGHLVLDPDRVIVKAKTNLSRLQGIHPRGRVASLLTEWSRILDHGVDAVFETLTSRSPHAAELRQSSPFAGVLSETTRYQVLEAFQGHWRAEHRR
jgi:excisionase family DNA binding protein